MKKLLTACVVAGLTTAAFVPVAHGHCQVPCGIYDDGARIHAMLEDTQTIAKAIDEIRKLASSHDAQGQNQLTRWIATKESHASNIITIVAEYFLTQRVKHVPKGAEGYDAYLTLLADHHRVMRAAMLAKQNTEPAHAEELRGAIEALGVHYH